MVIVGNYVGVEPRVSRKLGVAAPPFRGRVVAIEDGVVIVRDEDGIRHAAHADTCRAKRCTRRKGGTPRAQWMAQFERRFGRA